MSLILKNRAIKTVLLFCYFPFFFFFFLHFQFQFLHWDGPAVTIFEQTKNSKTKFKNEKYSPKNFHLLLFTFLSKISGILQIIKKQNTFFFHHDIIFLRVFFQNVEILAPQGTIQYVIECLHKKFGLIWNFYSFGLIIFRSHINMKQKWLQIKK